MAFQIENVNWERDQDRVKKLRESVFVIEWRLPREAEFDEHDSQAFHILISDDDKTPVATGRLTRSGEIGRIAVCPRHRTKTVYEQLFNALIAIARAENVSEIQVICDLESVLYHRRLGFSPRGPVFMEAGIARQRMACSSATFTLPDVSHMH